MAPARAVGAAERVSRHLASDGHSATRSWPCGHAVDPSTARPETIGGRTARKPGDRGGSRSGSWLRPDGRSGWTSWRPPSSARSRPSSGTRGCELRNLQWLVPTGRLCVFPRYFARVPTGELSSFSSLVSIGVWVSMAKPGDQGAGWRDPRPQAFPGAHVLRAGGAGRSVRNLWHAP